MSVSRPSASESCQLFVQPAAAATATATLTVSANVISSCTVTNGTLAFGDYAPTGTGNVDQTGTFTVACTKGTGATVGLGDGDNFLSGARRMNNGSEFLTYELYKESGRTNVWGNAGGALVTLADAASNAAQTLTVFGRIPPGQDVSIGIFRRLGSDHGHLLIDWFRWRRVIP